ncbi:YigZ family protein [Candidatus Bipolaricaulota bacterium]|nr:YigZ family protein [Candidatus Bipolaricaulota bacterium]
MKVALEMGDSYRTLKEEASARLNRNKSRFLSFVMPVSGFDAAESYLAELRHRYHDATHHCYALRLLPGEASIPTEVCEDDREPAGSAGLPILQQLRKADLLNVLAVVVRYFGGVKLGIGGLVRAYADATDAALGAAIVTIVHRRVEVDVGFPPEATSGIMSLIHRSGAKIVGTSYDKMSIVTVSLPPSRVEEFTGELNNMTSGQARWEVK